jgi:hypothetical protein
MRKILSTFRSRNHGAVFMVVQDTQTLAMQVWECNPNKTEKMTHCKTFPYEPDPNPQIRSRSESFASRQALNLADSLSRMTTSEVIKQTDNIRKFGKVR